MSTAIAEEILDGVRAARCGPECSDFEHFDHQLLPEVAGLYVPADPYANAFFVQGGVAQQHNFHAAAYCIADWT